MHISTPEMLALYVHDVRTIHHPNSDSRDKGRKAATALAYHGLLMIAKHWLETLPQRPTAPIPNRAAPILWKEPMGWNPLCTSQDRESVMGTCSNNI